MGANHTLIARDCAEPPAVSWQEEIARAIRDPIELLRELGLGEPDGPGALAAARQFPVLVPRPLLARMRRGDPDDPILRQVLPLHAESAPQPPGFTADPLAEQDALPVPGLVHKYPGRALVLAGPACAVHCRYCFRRHFPYAENRLGDEAWKRILAWLARHPEIHEVILSGGDPLVMSDSRLQRMGHDLAAIPHIRRLRLHTRLPVVVPARVTTALVEWVRNYPLPLVIVIHCNHPREIDAHVINALARLAAAGATLLNQAVLLRGVNDSVETLAELGETLLRGRVLPYYLHLLDQVSGSAHFTVPEAEALRLHGALRDRTSGFLLPRLVREVPGTLAKQPVTAEPGWSRCRE